MSSGVYIAVYCLVVLAMLLVAGYAYYAWQGYRQAMRDALVRRHERDLERGQHMDQNNFWRRTDPRSPPSVIEAVPVAFQTPFIRPTEVTYTTGIKVDL